MPAFSGQFNWKPGLIWNVGFISGSVAPQQIAEQGGLHVCPALVDTGATTTCIAKSVATALGLEPRGKAGMQTAGGAVDVNVYSVRMAFLFGEQSDSSGKKIGKGEIINTVIQAPEFEPGENTYQALIGRDILKMGVLSMSYDGHFSFAY